MRRPRIIGVLAVLLPTALSARVRFHPAGSGSANCAVAVYLADEVEWVGLTPLKDYPFRCLVLESDEQARARNKLTDRTKMASGKKTGDEIENRLAAAPVRAGHTEIDDIPDRLLILANRLQRALDLRRVVANAQPPGSKKN